MSNKKFHFVELGSTESDNGGENNENKSCKSKNKKMYKGEFFLLKSEDAYKEELIDMLEGVDLHALYTYLYSKDTAKVIKHKEKAMESIKKVVACKNRLKEINDFLFQMGKPMLDFSIFI